MDLKLYLTEFETAFQANDIGRIRLAAEKFLDNLSVLKAMPEGRELEIFENSFKEILAQIVANFPSFGLDSAMLFNALDKIVLNGTGVVQEAALGEIARLLKLQDGKFMNAALGRLDSIGFNRDDLMASSPQTVVRALAWILSQADVERKQDIYNRLLTLAYDVNVIDNHANEAVRALEIINAEAMPNTRLSAQGQAVIIGKKQGQDPMIAGRAFAIGAHSTHKPWAEEAFTGLAYIVMCAVPGASADDAQRDKSMKAAEQALAILNNFARITDTMNLSVQQKAVDSLLKIGSQFGFTQQCPDKAAEALAYILQYHKNVLQDTVEKACGKLGEIAVHSPHAVLGKLSPLLRDGNPHAAAVVFEVAFGHANAAVESLWDACPHLTGKQDSSPIAQTLFKIGTDERLIAEAPEAAVHALERLSSYGSREAAQALLRIAEKPGMIDTRPDVAMRALLGIQDRHGADLVAAAKRIKGQMPSDPAQPSTARRHIMHKLAATRIRWFEKAR